MSFFVKGVVFNLLESFICDGWGDETYESILTLCPLQTKDPFVGPGTYPDADLFTIASKAAQMLELPLPDALRAFGRYCFPRLVAKVPHLVDQAGGAMAFLLTVDSTIHIEVRKLMPRAITPRFEFREAVGGKVRLTYHSKRNLCAFMEGLLLGCADHFGESVVYEQLACAHDGADGCLYDVEFSGHAEDAA